MELIKRDDKYEYYELDGDDQHEYTYYSSDVIAIRKRDLYHKGIKYCLLNGYALPCEYSYLSTIDPLTFYGIDIDSIKIDNEYLKMEEKEDEQ